MIPKKWIKNHAPTWEHVCTHIPCRDHSLFFKNGLRSRSTIWSNISITFNPNHNSSGQLVSPMLNEIVFFENLGAQMIFSLESKRNPPSRLQDQSNRKLPTYQWATATAAECSHQWVTIFLLRRESWCVVSLSVHIVSLPTRLYHCIPPIPIPPQP